MLYRDLLSLRLIESLREDARTRNTHARKHMRARTKTDKQTKMQTSKQCRESGKRVIGWSGRERERTGVCVPDVLKRWWSGSCHLSSAMSALQDLAAEEAYACQDSETKSGQTQREGCVLIRGGGQGELIMPCLTIDCSLRRCDRGFVHGRRSQRRVCRTQTRCPKAGSN